MKQFTYYPIALGLVVAIDVNIPRSYHAKLVQGWIEENLE